jgi:hypothetical protein
MSEQTNQNLVDAIEEGFGPCSLSHGVAKAESALKQLAYRLQAAESRAVEAERRLEEVLTVVKQPKLARVVREALDADVEHFRQMGDEDIHIMNAEIQPMRAFLALVHPAEPT